MVEMKTESVGGAIIIQELEPHRSTRKLVQLLKQGDDAFVNHVGDEGDGLFEQNDDIVLCFNIENHPQRNEIVNYMQYDWKNDTFYMPEPSEEEQHLMLYKARSW